MSAASSSSGSPTAAITRTHPANASWAISRLIRGAQRELQVVASFPQAAYLAAGEDLVALVTSDGIRHPNAVVLGVGSERRPLSRLGVGRTGRIGDGGLSVGGLDLRVLRWWDPHPRLRTSTLEGVWAASDITRRRLRQLDGRVSATHDVMLDASVAMVVESLVTGDASGALAAAERCIGLGPGLTPSGDDRLAGLIAGTLVLAPSLAPSPGPDPAPTFGPSAGGAAGAGAPGIVAAVEQFGHAVSTAASGLTTSVSAALLRHAALGQLAEPATGLVRAWTSEPSPRVACPRPEPQDPPRNPWNRQHRRDEDAERSIVWATDRLLAVGSSSGRDLTLGLLAAVRLLTVDRARTIDPTPCSLTSDPCSPTSDPCSPTSDPRPRSAERSS